MVHLKVVKMIASFERIVYPTIALLVLLIVAGVGFYFVGDQVVKGVDNTLVPKHEVEILSIFDLGNDTFSVSCVSTFDGKLYKIPNLSREDALKYNIWQGTYIKQKVELPEEWLIEDKPPEGENATLVSMDKGVNFR
jgi:hypothetical protein